MCSLSFSINCRMSFMIRVDTPRTPFSLSPSLTYHLSKFLKKARNPTKSLHQNFLSQNLQKRAKLNQNKILKKNGSNPSTRIQFQNFEPAEKIPKITGFTKVRSKFKNQICAQKLTLTFFLAQKHFSAKPGN